MADILLNEQKNKIIISRWQSLNDEKMMLIEFLLTGIIHIYIIDKNMILQELYTRLYLCKKSIKQNGTYLVCVKEIM